MISAHAPSAGLARQLLLTADAVRSVRAGRSLDDALARVPGAGRPGVQALAYHVMRWLGSATETRAHLVPRTPAAEVDALLATALALLWPASSPPYPDHTLVDQAVRAVRERAPAAAGLVNAVLRRFIRERDAIVQQVQRTPAGAWNHPEWWIERLRRDWPDHWRALLVAANERPPMTLRVNVRRCTGEAYVQRLADAGHSAIVLPDEGLHGQAVVLAEPCPVTQLPGFAEGDVSVQDAAAQRAAGLLLGPGLRPGARVLDACAAPGGKTAHLLERGELDLLALDRDPERLARVAQTLQRLGLQARCQAADARRPADWWDGQAFDAILLDAPCSASGIVRRHPDIRWLRRPTDIDQLAGQQDELLEALWPLLAPGGRLLMATCSVFKAEGCERIDAFLQRRAAGEARLDPTSPGHLLPLSDNGSTVAATPGSAPQDGFFYALLHKT